MTMPKFCLTPVDFFNILHYLHNTNKEASSIWQLMICEPHPVKRTEKKYKVFPASSHSLLAVFYAARQSACFSIGVRTPRLRWTRLVL